MQALDELFEMFVDARNIRQVGVRVGYRHAPDGLALDVFAPERGALPVDAFGQEGVAVGEPRSRIQEPPFGVGE